MSERVRNALFNSLSSHIVNAHVLDTFAGTGALGLESLSRGAERATFIERDRLAQKSIAASISNLDVEAETQLITTTVNNWLEQAHDVQYDIIFADPPYHDMQLQIVAKLKSVLKSDGLLILSRPGKLAIPPLPGLVVTLDRVYGDIAITTYIVE